jgi:frataxin
MSTLRSSRLILSRVKSLVNLSSSAPRITRLAKSPVLFNRFEPLAPLQLRLFQSEIDYHKVADSTLETIQEQLDEVIEDSGLEEAEVMLANGVLTLHLPPHGTWVLNKQAPNMQLWWSSPLSGPKRFEYQDECWCATQNGLALGPLLVQEVRRFYPDIPEFEIDI